MSQNYVAAQIPSQVPPLVSATPTLPAPTLLSLTQHMPDGSLDTVGAGRTTADTQPALVFVAIPGDTYTLYDNGVLVGTLTAVKDVTGWTLPPLDNGSHALSLTYATADGVSFPLQFAFNVEAAPAAPVITDIHAALDLWKASLPQVVCPLIVIRPSTEQGTRATRSTCSTAARCWVRRRSMLPAIGRSRLQTH